MGRYLVILVGICFLAGTLANAAEGGHGEDTVPNSSRQVAEGADQVNVIEEANPLESKALMDLYDQVNTALKNGREVGELQSPE